MIQLCPEVLEKKDLLIPLIGFRYFVIIWPWKSAGYFIWKKKLNPLDPRMLLLSLVEIGSRILKKKVLFLISSIRFRYSVVPYHWKRTGSFICTWIPFTFTQGCFGHGLVKLVHWFLRRCINIVNVFFAISLSSPLGKGRGSSFGHSWIALMQGCIVPSLDEIVRVVLEKRMKIWKVYRQRDRQRRTDDGPWWTEKLI